MTLMQKIALFAQKNRHMLVLAFSVLFIPAFIVLLSCWARGAVWQMKCEEQKLIAAEYVSQHAEMQKFYVSGGCADPNAYIAHGGGIEQYVYTNSREAVEDSISRGFKFIEIDLLETTDGHLVGGHDWRRVKEMIGVDDITDAPMSMAEIRKYQGKGGLTVLSGDDIAEIMEKNPDIILVTDKIENYRLLLREIPHPDRMIVEVFSWKGYVDALHAGVQYPALCLWGTKDVEEVEKHGIPIVTMSAKAFFDTPEHIDIVQRLHDNHVTILLFDYEDVYDRTDFMQLYLGKTVSKFYTNHWAPNKLP